MMSDLKLIIKGMKYGANRKTCFLMPFLLLFIAIMNLRLNSSTNYFAAGIMFIAMNSMFSQLFNSLLISNLVSSSPKKRRMVIRNNMILNGLCALNGIILYAISLSVLYQLGRLPASSIGCLLVVQAVTSIFFSIVVVITYKFYIFTVIGVFVGLMLGLIATGELFTEIPFISINTAILIAILCIVVGCLLSWIISKLLYRYPISKVAMQSMLRRGV